MRKQQKNRSPVQILDDFLWKLIPGNYSVWGETFEWKVSRDFWDHDFSALGEIEADFQQEYESVVSRIKEAWGEADFQGNRSTSNFVDWYWGSIIDMSCWEREEGVAYVVYHRDDKELPYEITLGAITEEAIEENGGRLY